MSKLHELLAVEGSLESQAEKVRADLQSTFEKKRHLFEEKRTVFTPNTEGAESVVEEQSDIQTTVRRELRGLAKYLAKSIDASYAVAETNCTARADVTMEDGKILIANAPATALLELEKRVAALKSLLDAIPTLDPAKGYTLDANRPDGVYQAREVRKTRTKKVSKPVVLYEATKEHPAQVQLASEDIPVGTILEQQWSSMLSPLEKSDLIARCEQVGRAIRQARCRANEQTVISNKVGGALVGAILLD